MKANSTQSAVLVQNVYTLHFILEKNPDLFEIKRYVFDSSVKTSPDYQEITVLIRSCSKKCITWKNLERILMNFKVSEFKFFVDFSRVSYAQKSN